MYLNEFASGVEPLDMTQFDEFSSLLQSAADLEIAHSRDVRYVSRNVVIKHLRFHFLEWGDPAAPPMLLLHGGNQSAHSWDLVSISLADRFHVFALDQRGHGDSEWARDGDYALPTRADDAYAFMQAMGMDRPIIMAHSMGGLTTLTLCLQRPDVARALAIVDVGPEISIKGSKTIGTFVRANVEFASLDQFVENVSKYDPFRSREHILRTARYNLIQRADGTLVHKADHTGGRSRSDDPKTDEELRRTFAIPMEAVRVIPVPTLVVRGAQSNILEPEQAERFVQELPQGRLVTVPKSGHNVHSQNTPGFLEVVGPFFDAL